MARCCVEWMIDGYFASQKPTEWSKCWRSQLNSERGSVSKEDSLAHAEQENGKKLYELAFEKEG